MNKPPPTTHLLPRTAEGWTATIAFLGLFLLAMPPVTHRVLDRPESWFLGVPFFMFALFLVYTVLIGVLIWAYRKGI